MQPVKVMGIVNVTPDSFSDGGKFNKPEEAVRRAKNLIADGADIIDIGGESTRPGATPITWREEWSRIEPVLERIIELSNNRNNRIRISVDTYHPETAERAIAAGATMINCVKTESAEAMLRLAEVHPGVELVLPAKYLAHLSPTSTPTPTSTFFSHCYLDPMIGFDTTREEDLELLRSVPELAKKGRVLVGASRKRIVKKLTGEKTPGKDIAGNLAIAMWAAMNGASAVRVHDVRETVQALKVLSAIDGNLVR